MTHLETSHFRAFLSFILTAVTAPLLGILASNKVTAKLGGLTQRRALYASCFGGLCCLCFAVPIPFMDEFRKVAGLLWFFLFFGGFTLPTMTSLIVNIIQKELRT
mmetsp:Transcript_33021/g.50594  ORF Transcript_33021/g.50594 Transcript_33021/m.50594 type:complete len:105 (+) Transcript_33021:1601-1915(+)